MTDAERERMAGLLLACGYRRDAGGNFRADGDGWEFSLDEFEPETRAKLIEHLKKSIRRLWYHQQMGAQISPNYIRGLAEALGFMCCVEAIVPEWSEADRW